MRSEHEKMIVETILNFYNYDYDLLFEFLDDNACWYGPKQGQYILGKQNLQRALNWSRKLLTFEVEDISTKIVCYEPNMFTCLAEYKLRVNHIDGTQKKYHQHVVASVRRFRDMDGKIYWRSPFVHVSNLVLSDDDREFAIKQEQNYPTLTEERRLAFRGAEHSTVYIRENAIKYISGGKGVKAYIHTHNEVYLVNMLLKDIETMLPDNFCRCQSSYIININRVVSINRQRILLNDKTEIPVSSKRYADIKKYIDEYLAK
ncbi:MAG TPA: LytTR family transcriptional regulator [Clostridiales bacterium]|nr:LytTR family transcriptional regulator [Clostridiales bacterium]